MASYRVRLFILPHNPAPRDHAEEGPGFSVDGIDLDDDAIRARVRERLVEWGYKVRTVSALANVKPGEATYAATVEAPAKAGEGARS